MNPLDDRLRSALHQQTPSAGFTGRVLERIKREQAASGGAIPPPARRTRWFMYPIAAGLLVVLLAAGVYQQRDQEAREERAGRQAVVALQIAAEKLNLARDQALRLDSPDAIENSAQKDPQ